MVITNDGNKPKSVIFENGGIKEECVKNYLI